MVIAKWLNIKMTMRHAIFGHFRRFMAQTKFTEKNYKRNSE